MKSLPEIHVLKSLDNMCLSHINILSFIITIHNSRKTHISLIHTHTRTHHTHICVFIPGGQLEAIIDAGVCTFVIKQSLSRQDDIMKVSYPSCVVIAPLIWFPFPSSNLSRKSTTYSMTLQPYMVILFTSISSDDAAVTKLSRYL